MFCGFWAWIGPYFAYFKGPGPGFEPTLGSFRGPGPGFGPILGLNRPTLGIWYWIRAILGDIVPILSLNRPISGIWDWIWAISRGPGTGFESFRGSWAWILAYIGLFRGSWAWIWAFWDLI